MLFSNQKLVLATHNQGKVSEMRALLCDVVETVLSAGDVDLPEPEETEKTFKGNALLKARAACEHSGYSAIADDSGLCVNALNGEPGIYSARWAANEQGERDFGLAMQMVKDRLGDAEDRSAYFITVLALVCPDGTEHVFEGRVHGVITKEARGLDGFGYDPIFQPEGYDITFGEMDKSVKQAISHRATAMAKLIEFLNHEYVARFPQQHTASSKMVFPHQKR